MLMSRCVSSGMIRYMYPDILVDLDLRILDLKTTVHTLPRSGQHLQYMRWKSSAKAGSEKMDPQTPAHAAFARSRNPRHASSMSS